MSTDGPGAPSSDASDRDLSFEWTSAEISAIGQGLSIAGDTHDLSAAIKAGLEEEVSDHTKAVVRALDYYARRSSTRPSSIDDIYRSMFSNSSGYSYPEPLSEASRETVEAWRDAALLFDSNDVFVARINDLLWCKKSQPRPDLRARAAFAGLLRTWNISEVASVNRCDALVRALQIAVELQDEAMIVEAVQHLVGAVNATILDEEWAPGVALPMIEAMAGLKSPAQQPADLDSLIAAARDRYEDDPFIVEAVQLLRMQRSADGNARREIATQTIAMWRDHAEKRGGLVGLSHLERALELARNEGLTDIANDLRQALEQPKTPDELGMQKIAAEVSIPHEAVDQYIKSFVDTSGSKESLTRLGLHSPISDVDADADRVREQMREHPLVHLFTTVVTDETGLPLAHITGDDQKFEHALIRDQAMSVTLWGSFLRQILQRLAEEGRVSPDDVREFLEGPIIDQRTAQSVAQAYDDFIAGDYEACLHRVLPRIERVIRTMARLVGLSVYREPTIDGRTQGAYKGLGELLGLLQGRIPEHCRRYIMILLSERTGLNLRNRAAHGLMDEVAPEEAALAMHTMLILALWSIDGTDGD